MSSRAADTSAAAVVIGAGVIGAAIALDLERDPAFGDDAGGAITAFYDGDRGYIDDPMLAARNLAHAARHHGAHFRFRTAVTAVRRAGGRVLGPELDDGTSVGSGVVVDVGGPKSGTVMG